MEEPEPNDEVFCPILWQANGGQIKPNGNPIFIGDIVRGRCRYPGNCDRCRYMQNSLMVLQSQGITSLWVCPSCVSQIRELTQESGVQTKLPGFYAEGFCQRPQCYRIGENKYSIILQLLTVFGTYIP